MMNQSVHAVDLIQWIAGPVKQVSAYASSLIHPEIEVEDTLAGAIVFESGAYGVIMGATSMWPGGSVRIEVGGETGSAVAEGGLRHWRFKDESEEQSKTFKDEINSGAVKSSGGGSDPRDVPNYMHQLNVESILTAWENNQEAETSGIEARKAIAIILALYESARQGGAPVKVK